MSTDKPAETFRSKLGLLLIDKAFLGVLLILVAYWFNANLQQQGKGIDYQKTIFDRRVEAYLDVLQKSQRVTDELALYWGSSKSTGPSAQLSDLEKRWHVLSNRSGAGSSSWSDLSDVFPALRDLESSWRSRSIYFSPPASAAVDEFLRTVYADLDQELGQFEHPRKAEESGRREAETEFQKAAWLRAEQSFQKLRNEIQTRLKLNGIILDLG
jgi:hypothetical protein